MAEKKYYYSEIFHSIQGEGHYTGVPTAWIRFFLCNLQCSGFGQIDPTNPDSKVARKIYGLQRNYVPDDDKVDKYLRDSVIVTVNTRNIGQAFQ